MENPFLASFFCILTSPAIKIQDGRLRSYWKCNLKVNGHRHPCNITFPTKCGIGSPFLAQFVYFVESKYHNSKCPLFTNFIFSFLSHITHITCWISYGKLVFSNMCLFAGIISCILMSPNILIQDGGRWPYWKCASKENRPRSWCNTTFLIKCFKQSPFLKSFSILTSLNVEVQDGRHLRFSLFSDLSHTIHCSCWMLHQKLVSNNICWFYMVLLHIFPQLSPRKVEINNLFD